MKITEKWAYTFNNDEIFHSPLYDTAEDALADGIEEAIEHNQENDEEDWYTTISVGKVTEFVPYIDADIIIDAVQEQANNEAGEASWKYLDKISNNEKQELSDMLAEAFNKWAEKTHNKPDFTTITQITEHKINMEKNNEKY